MINAFIPISPAQARALGRIAATKNAPKKFIMGIDNQGSGCETLVVVPPSCKDNRRWDISPGGKITKGTR